MPLRNSDLFKIHTETQSKLMTRPKQIIFTQPQGGKNPEVVSQIIFIGNFKPPEPERLGLRGLGSAVWSAQAC